MSNKPSKIAVLIRTCPSLHPTDPERHVRQVDRAVRDWLSLQRPAADADFFHDPDPDNRARPVFDTLWAELERGIAGKYRLLLVPTLTHLGNNAGNVAIRLAYLATWDVAVVVLSPKMTLHPRKSTLVCALSEVEHDARKRARKHTAEVVAERGTRGRPAWAPTAEHLAEVERLLAEKVSIRKMAKDEMLTWPRTNDTTGHPTASAITRALKAGAGAATEADAGDDSGA